MPRRSSWTPMAKPLKPLPMMATLKPSGSSGLPSVHSVVQGNSLNDGSSRRASNSRSPISSAVAMFMSARSSASGGSSTLAGPAFCSSHATALLIRSSRCASSRLAAVGSWASSGSPVCWYSVTRTAFRSATSTARRMNAESTVVSMVSVPLRVGACPRHRAVLMCAIARSIVAKARRPASLPIEPSRTQALRELGTYGFSSHHLHQKSRPRGRSWEVHASSCSRGTRCESSLPDVNASAVRLLTSRDPRNPEWDRRPSSRVRGSHPSF